MVLQFEGHQNCSFSYFGFAVLFRWAGLDVAKICDAFNQVIGSSNQGCFGERICSSAGMWEDPCNPSMATDARILIANGPEPEIRQLVLLINGSVTAFSTPAVWPFDALSAD